MNLFGIAEPQAPPRISAVGRWRLIAPPGKREFGTYSWDIELEVGPIPGYLPMGAGLRPSYAKDGEGGSLRLDGDVDKITFYEKAPPDGHLRFS